MQRTTIVSATGITEVVVLTDSECQPVASYFPTTELRKAVVIAVDDVDEGLNSTLQRIYSPTNRDQLFQELQLKYAELHQQHQALLQRLNAPTVTLAGPTSGGMS